MKHALLIVLIICSLCHSSRAQPYYFGRYQVEHGLSNNAVTCSLLDRKGFMWFGTKDGLNRFDGYNFKVFRRDPKEKKSLGNNFIYSLCENDDGNLWVGTDRGLYLYDYASESFTFLKACPAISVRSILRDAHHNLWFIAGADLYRRDQKGKTISYAGLFQATSLVVQGIHLWIGLAQGLMQQYDYRRDRFICYPDLSRKPSAQSYSVEKLFCDNPDRIYMGTSTSGVKVFDTRHFQYHEIGIRSKMGQDLYVRDLVRRSANELWVATEAGIFAYNEQTGRYTQLKKQYNDHYSLSDNAVYTLCKDREGGIWAGTYFGGINYYPAQYTPFEKFFPRAGENSISGNAVREICKDEHGNLWIGTEDAGLNKLDLRTGRFTHFNPFDGRSGIVNSNIHGLLASGNKLWIGTFEHGLDVMDVRTGKVFRHYQAGPGPHYLQDNFVYCLFQTTDGEILAGTSVGLAVYDAGHDKFAPVRQTSSDAFYTTLAQDSQGKIWAGTFRDGVFVFRLKNPAGKQSEAINIPGLVTNRVTGILESSDHLMWITTESGLFCCSLSGRILKHYTTDDGLPGDLLYSLKEDKNGRLWISSSKGLICLDRSRHKIQVFTKSDGLLTDQFNYNSAFKDANGRMFFGCVKGLIAFNPTRFVRSSFVPPVYITGFQVHNQELVADHPRSPLKQSIILTREITLDHNSSTFSIDFSALSFTSPGSIEYAYKMEGLDQQWTYIRKNRRAYFTELPPGYYVFKVKATNSSLGWTTGVTQLNIRIIPPFWKSSVAYLCYFIFLVIIVLVSIKNYKRKLERLHQRRREIFENEKEKEIYQAKIDFFINLAHEIRTPLTLIRVPMEKLIKRASQLPDIEKSLQTMNRNTERLLSLTNQLLDFRSTETEGFSLSFVKANVSELLRDIWTNFQPAAEHSALKYRLLLPEKALFAYIDPEALTKIVSNLLDNGIKYAKAEVRLQLTSISADDELFKIEVASDSKPLSPDQQKQIFEPFFRRGEDMHKSGTGLGLAIARALTELHGGKLELGEPRNGFIIFVLELPVHQLFEFNLEGKWKK